MNRRLISIVLVAAVGLVCIPLAATAASRFSNNDGGRDEVVTRLISGASSEQQAALADQSASEDGRAAAAERTMQCLRDAGVNVVLTPERGAGQFRFGGGTAEEQQHASSVYSACYARFQREIDMIHSIQQRPLDEASRPAAETALLRCLRDEGVAVEMSASKDVWWELRLTSPTEFAHCGLAVIAEFGALP